MAHRRHGTRADMYGLAHRPGDYDRHAGWLGRPLHRRVLADVAAAGLPDGALVVDIGTGPGRVPMAIAAAHPELRVEGLDLAEEMIAHAAATAAAEGLPEERVRFRVGDAAALPYADGEVDLVVSTVSLHHWDRPAEGLAEVRRVLAPGGRGWIYDLGHVLRRADPAGLREPMWGGLVGRLVPLRRLTVTPLR